MVISEPSRPMHRPERNRPRQFEGAAAGSGASDAQDEEDEKPRTLFVGNVPREVHKREIEEVFGDIGPLKRCYIQYPRDGNEKKKQREDTTVAYVTYALSQDATKALETLQNTKIGNNRMNIKFAKARSEQVRPSFGGEGRGRFQSNANFEPIAGAIQKPKEPRPKPIKKKSRLIIRNLSFKVTEEKMREHFQQFGDLKDINILKKPNGKLVGCAFVQYQNIYQAANAIKELNLKPFLGRPIAIDWALPKEKYQTDDEKNRKKEAQEELENEDGTANEESAETIVIKDEPESEMEDDSGHFNALDPYQHLKDEPMDVTEIKDEEPLDSKTAVKRKLKSESSDDEEDDDDDDEDDSMSENSESEPKRRKQQSNDVEEGKTLFLRNLAFDTSQDELKEFFEKFGPVHYALLCKDPLTEHPKGTGFVKYKDKSAADKCLEQYEDDSSEFKLKSRQISVSVALSKEKVERKAFNPDQQKKSGDQKEKNSKTPKSDSRNLYLVREGFIRPGSAAAADVSISDMNKRSSLNQVKKQMLKNLNIFISPTRLCVHNLPPTFSDTKLRKLFVKHAGPGAKITEARIMRDMKDIDLNGKGKSKEYGFVNFTQHEHALTALRAINNNPTIFKPNQRPVVEFSLENRMALKAKEKRAQKSKEKNPNLLAKKDKESKNVEQNDDEEENSEDEDNQKKNKNQKAGKKNKDGKSNASHQISDESKEEEGQQGPKYAGLVGKKGVQTVPSFKPKGKITRNSLKQKKSKKTKKLQERKQREPKVPSKRPIERIDKTEKMITKYKQKLHSDRKGDDGKKKKKWFE